MGAANGRAAPGGGAPPRPMPGGAPPSSSCAFLLASTHHVGLARRCPVLEAPTRARPEGERGEEGAREGAQPLEVVEPTGEGERAGPGRRWAELVEEPPGLTGRAPGRRARPDRWLVGDSRPSPPAGLPVARGDRLWPAAGGAGAAGGCSAPRPGCAAAAAAPGSPASRLHTGVSPTSESSSWRSSERCCSTCERGGGASGEGRGTHTPQAGVPPRPSRGHSARAHTGQPRGGAARVQRRA